MYENESTFVLDFYTKDMRLYSIIIPVYNRPDELDDLLSSLCKQTYVHFEVIVVEDGSEIPAKEIVGRYQGRLDLYYYVISNSGPGMARNHGARQALGEYLLILDSDVVLPSTWLEHIHDSLNHYPVDAFGGPDKAHASFSPIQKAINYAMTSFLTTGGIRGGKKKLDKFYPRSFNMGIRRDVYERLGGFPACDMVRTLILAYGSWRLVIGPGYFLRHGFIIKGGRISCSSSVRCVIRGRPGSR